jgi:hypothetical protein
MRGLRGLYDIDQRELHDFPFGELAEGVMWRAAETWFHIEM